MEQAHAIAKALLPVLLVVATITPPAAMAADPESIALVCSLKRQDLLLENAHDVIRFEDVERVLVAVYTPATSNLTVSADIKRLFAEALSAAKHSEVDRNLAAPKPLHHWAFLDEQGRPICLISLYVGNLLSISGLSSVGEQIYQARQDENWCEVLDSGELLEALANVTGLNYTQALEMIIPTPAQSEPLSEGSGVAEGSGVGP